MEDEKEVPHLTLDNFHLDSQVGLFGGILLHLTQEKQSLASLSRQDLQ